MSTRAKRRILPTVSAWGLVWLLLGLLASGFCGEARPYRIESEVDVAYARKMVHARLAPMLPRVLSEAGLPDGEASDFTTRFGNPVMVNTQVGQIDYDFTKATELLAALPKNVREKFLRLSYQWTGPSTLWRDEVAAALALTPDQSRQVAAIVTDSLEQLAPINRPDFSYGMTAEQDSAYRRRTAEIEAERDRRLLGVLSSRQQQAWLELIGPPSKALQNFRDYCAEFNPK